MALDVVRDALGELRHKLRPLGPGPHEAHITAHDVENLRQLIHPQLADHVADTGRTRILGLRPLRLTGAFRIGAHAAEFQDVKREPTEPDAGLTVQHRCAQAVLELDGQRGHEHRWQRHQQDHRARRQIQAPGGEQSHRIAPEAFTEDEPARIQHIDGDAPGLALEEGQQLGDIDARKTAFEEFRDRKTAPTVLHRHHDLINPVFLAHLEQTGVYLQNLPFGCCDHLVLRLDVAGDREPTPISATSQRRDRERALAGPEHQNPAPEGAFVHDLAEKPARHQYTAEGEESRQRENPASHPQARHLVEQRGGEDEGGRDRNREAHNESRKV